MWLPGKREQTPGKPKRTLESSLAPRSLAPRVASDCERLLDGSYLDSACAARAGVPCWAWLNKLTHCAEAELVLIARRPFAFERRPELHAFARTLSFLAGELVQSAGRCGRAIAELQREVLVPLELELMGATFGPSELARSVLLALEEHARHCA